MYIPNRSIANVVNYPRGYVRALLDVRLLSDPAAADRAQELVVAAAQRLHEQVQGLFVAEPSVEGRLPVTDGGDTLRVKFRIWPGRGGVSAVNGSRYRIPESRTDLVESAWLPHYILGGSLPAEYKITHRHRGLMSLPNAVRIEAPTWGELKARFGELG